MPFFTLLLTFAFSLLAFADPGYKVESPLPKGWPQPGPFEEVVVKSYPTTRVAVNRKNSFMTLFRHIKRENIPMTAPVVMTLTSDSLKPQDMQFVYQSTEVGTAGDTGKKVEVLDLPQVQAYTYAWVGDDSRANIARAKEAIQAQIAAKKLIDQVIAWRQFSYNSPFTPKSKRCYEIQAVLKP